MQVPELKTVFEDEFFDVFMDQLGRVLDIPCGALSSGKVDLSRRLMGDPD